MLALAGQARDLITDRDGRGRVTEKADLSGRVAFFDGRILTDLETTPARPELSSLIGTMAGSGFRARIDELAPDLRETRAPLFLLLDEVPIATLISGHAAHASGLFDGVENSAYVPAADQCAGFVTGGLLMTSFETLGRSVVNGPDAPDIEDPDDPDGWHALSELPLHGMRRRRRIDVYDSPDGTSIVVDAMFRDSYVRSDGIETIIHEYELNATVEEGSERIITSSARPRVLPSRDCPGAVASASRIAGMTLGELNTRVKAEMRGTSTCTHLNDLLRSVADTSHLVATLRRETRDR